MFLINIFCSGKFSILIFAAAVLFFSGCLCDPEHCGYPDLFHPGHITEQQEKMKRFDPFTRDTMGPKISGDRPQGSETETPLPQHFEQYK
jgi:hypothetical protein